MLQGSSRRFLAGLLLSVMATALAACGIAPAPTYAPGTATSGIYARRPVKAANRYGMTFDRQTPRVRFVSGSVNAGLPARVDLRAKLSPIDKQGDLNSCTGFAIAGLAEYRERLRGRTADLSPGFIYVMELNQEKRLGEDGGARITTGMNVLKQFGIAPETLHPYLSPMEQTDGERVVSYLKALPTPVAMKAAQPFRVPATKEVKDLSDFKTAIAQGRPVVFGIAVFASFETDDVKRSGIIPLPAPETEGFLGGHAILAVGYDDVKQQVIFRNSYGTEWGDKGYGYLPYGYFKKELAGDAWQAP